MPKQIEMISYLKLFATVSPKHTVSESFFFCHSSIHNIQSLFHLTICLLQDHNLPSHCLEAKSALSRTVIFLLWFHDGWSLAGAWDNFVHFSQVPPWLLQATPLHRPIFSFTFYHSFPWPYHFCGMVSMISCHHAPLSFHVIVYTISLWLFFSSSSFIGSMALPVQHQGSTKLLCDICLPSK